jgi:hypothetical protein
MEWIRKILKKIFHKDKVKLIGTQKNVENKKEIKNDFQVMLKQNSNLEYDDRNGYKIIPKMKLKDRI